MNLDDMHIVFARGCAIVAAFLVIYLIACGLAAVWAWIARNLR